MKRRICFLTTNDFGFGGSEDLWIATALELLGRGNEVAASVRRWQPLPIALQRLQSAGCIMLWHEAPVHSDDFAELVEFSPDLVVVSQGYQLEGLDWLERIVEARLPFVLINQCVHEVGWLAMDESVIERMKRLHCTALEFMFVSSGNRRLYEKMTGFTLTNASVIRNPFKVPYNIALPWPESDDLRIATVGRIECFHKGYDLLFEALQDPRWHIRSIQLNIFGDGPHRKLLERLAERSGFRGVHFHGYVSDITASWKHNHVLVQPSRLEGLPLSIVEAQLCGRVVVATDVAGHSEVIEDGKTGFLAEAPTARHLDKAMERMWSSRDRLQQIAAASRKSIRDLVPSNPAGTLADRLDAMVRNATSDQEAKRSPVPLARVIPRSPRQTDDHHAHLYYATDGAYSEGRKLTADYPVKKWIKLRFSGLQGNVRFDPGARSGIYRIRRLTVSETGSTSPLLVAEGQALDRMLHTSGTVTDSRCDDTCLVIHSNGDDPVVQVDPNVTTGLDTFVLEFDIYSE